MYRRVLPICEPRDNRDAAASRGLICGSRDLLLQLFAADGQDTLFRYAFVDLYADVTVKGKDKGSRGC